ncbi:MAG TPA: pantoate--beta-alanine ligase [Nitrospira sp.]|nr:pantoate--beta-alanine ligase [Nitrospira sp.]
MKTIHSPSAMTGWSRCLRREGVVIGLVPTMGALHEGHRALIRAARLHCDALVVSIFVNPTQFAPTEDLATYPRRLSQDRALCREEGVDVCFEPTAAAMYPKGYQTVVTVPVIARRWEGESRPHHFAGVATVVAKLFGIVEPNLACFGQKDFQQCAVVRQLVKDLNFDIRLLVRPTVRERDGLAMSSRNVFLSTEERRLAPIFYHALLTGQRAIASGMRDSDSVQAVMRKVLGGEPSIRIDYLAICDRDTLAPLDRIDRPAVILGAIRLGSVRLIDNVLAERKSGQQE